MTKTNFYLKHRLIFNCALLTLLFLVNCFWGGMSFVVFPLLAVMVLLDNLENGFSYILFCMPYRLINFTTSNIIYYIAIIVYIIKFCFVFFVKEKGKIEKSVLILLGVLVVYCLLPIGNYNYNLFFKLCSIIFVIGAMLLIVKKPNVFRPLFSVRLISVSLLISCLMGLTYFISPYLQTTNLMVVSSNDGSVFRYFGLFRQPNVLAMMCEIIISCLAAAIISQKCNWLDVLLFVLVAAAGVTTFSKTYIIILAVVLFALFVGLMKVNWKKTLLFSLIIVLCGLVVYFIKPVIFTTFVNRFVGKIANCNNFEGVVNMITTGRLSLWKETANYLGNNPLVLIFGRGLGAPALSTLSAHNAYLSMIYQLGLVGSALFVLVIAVLIKQLLKQNKISAAIIIPVIVLALIFCVEDMIFYIL